MNFRFPAIVTAALWLAACGGPGNESVERAAMSAPPPAPMMEQGMAMDGSYAKAGGGSGPTEEVAQQYIAYSHSLGMRLPVK